MTDNPETPRGIRNNNPGNIRFNPDVIWIGQNGHDDDGFATFRSPEDGLRAVAVLLRHYHVYHHCDTLVDYVARWAPPAENDTRAYIHYMGRYLTVGPNTVLDLDVELPGMVNGIVEYENGECPYDQDTILRAIARSRNQ